MPPETLTGSLNRRSEMQEHGMTNLTDAAKGAIVGVGGVASGMSLYNVNQLASLIVTVLTGLYILLKIIEHFAKKKK